MKINHIYQVIFGYKSANGVSPAPKERKPFNLLDTKEDICIQGHFANMLTKRKTNVSKFIVTENVYNQMKDYDKKQVPTPRDTGLICGRL